MNSASQPRSLQPMRVTYNASFTSPKTNSYEIRKRLRKFFTSLESWRFRSAFLAIIDHGARKKSNRGWTSRVRLARGPSPYSPSSPSVVSMSSINSTSVFVGSEHCQGDNQPSPDTFMAVVRCHEINLRVVYMLSVLHVGGIPLCLGEIPTCAGCAAMPDGYIVVLPKAHAYFKPKTANTIASDLHWIWVP